MRGVQLYQVVSVTKNQLIEKSFLLVLVSTIWGRPSLGSQQLALAFGCPPWARDGCSCAHSRLGGTGSRHAEGGEGGGEGEDEDKQLVIQHRTPVTYHPSQFAATCGRCNF